MTVEGFEDHRETEANLSEKNETNPGLPENSCRLHRGSNLCLQAEDVLYIPEVKQAGAGFILHLLGWTSLLNCSCITQLGSCLGGNFFRMTYVCR